jgi:predicted alpha/beta-fold hydrolase
MSNAITNKQQDMLIEQTDNQRNPFLARPEDFEVLEPSDAAKPMARPFHGQTGDSKTEYNRLLQEAPLTGKGAPLPTQTDDAGAPHTPGFGNRN